MKLELGQTIYYPVVNDLNDDGDVTDTYVEVGILRAMNSEWCTVQSGKIITNLFYDGVFTTEKDATKAAEDMLDND